MLPTPAFLNLGPWEIIIIAVVALLIFGRRLPEVGRSLGKGIVEFKKGLAGIEEEVKTSGKTDAEESPKHLGDASEQQKVNIGERDKEESPKHS